MEENNNGAAVSGGAVVLSYGQKAVGLSFNPSNDPDVQRIKESYAKVIDILNTERNNPESTQEQKRLYSIAITEAQAAQMWAVKAITWKD